MALTLGSHLGPYEILALVGAGGMGEVYRARDTRLNRTVAIKVLSAEHTSRPDFLLRFEREARAISSFNHPYICAIYDVGQHDGLHYLVMEYLEGETLAERLRKAPMRLEEMLQYSLQLADALSQAHRKGQVHRDLKPANVMLTRSGAKLLDFGLARQVRSTTGDDGETRTKVLTEEGTIVGTYPYMSPEQLQGREVDSRSDIFSFGAMLYEMATGRRAFSGDSAASLIAAILEREPAPVSELRPALPPALDWIIRTCLKKDPEDRWQTVHDLRLELERLRDAPSSPTVVSQPGRGQRNGLLLAAAGLACILLGVAVAGLYRTSETPREMGVLRLEISAPPAESFANSWHASVPVITFAVSPDGRKIAFVASIGSAARIWIRSLEDPVSRPLTGTEGAQGVFWSQDSEWIGFFAQQNARTVMRKIEARGGPAIPICQVSIDPRGAAWLPSGIIVYAPSNRHGLMQVPAAGGQPKPIAWTDKSADTRLRWWPSPLPDGKRFLYYDRRQSGIYIGSIEGASSKRVVTSDYGGVYVEPGYLLYLSGSGVVMAQRFDAQSETLAGEPVPVAEGASGTTAGMPGLSVSHSGILAHSPLLLEKTRLSWYSRQGALLQHVTESAYHSDPRLSPQADPRLPQASRIAWSQVDPSRFTQDIWLHDPDRHMSTRFSSEPGIEASPIWSRDSRRILYRSNREGLINLYIRDSGGGPDDPPLFSEARQFEAHGGAHNLVATDWSADGLYVVYTVPGINGFDLFALPLQAPRTPRPLARSDFNEVHGALSPDGRRLALASDESGRFEVHVQAFPEASGKQQISAQGGREPQWRADGRELFFVAADGKMMAANVNAAGEIGKPQPLFATRIAPASPYRWNYQPSADGQTFLINSPVEDNLPAAITVVVNWPALLKK